MTSSPDIFQAYGVCLSRSSLNAGQDPHRWAGEGFMGAAAWTLIRLGLSGCAGR